MTSQEIKTQEIKMAPLKGQPSERVRKMRDEMLDNPFEYDLERARCYTRIWKQMLDSPPCIRKAKALEEYLRCAPIKIGDLEHIVGVKSIKPRADPFEIELGNHVGVYDLLLNESVDEKVKDFFRERYAFLDRYVPFTEEELDELKEIIDFWKGRTLSDRKIELWKEAGIYEDFTGPFSEAMNLLLRTSPDTYCLATNGQGHTIPGYRRVLKIGFEGIKERAAEELKKLEKTDKEHEQRKDFYEAVQVTAKAVCNYSNRYADLAMEMAESETGQRREELLEIADRIKRVPAHPAKTFREAIQSIWMTNVVMEMSYGELNVFSQGRVDQYLYPYYKKDLEEGRITYEEALELIEEYLVKLSSCVIAGQNNITIGGLDKEGKDATNDVSYMFLEAFANVKGLLNTLSVRISSKTPRDFKKRTLEVYRFTGGMGIHNDDMLIPSFEDEYSSEDARDYSIVGCVEPHGTGNDSTATGGNGIWLGVVFSMALNEGRVLLSGDRQVGAKTPDPATFETFEDVKQAFVDQLSYAIDRAVKLAELKDKAFAEGFPSPLLSSTIEGCLESGKDITQKGAHYNHSCINCQALGTVVDSLAAIQWAVFEKEIVTMEELMKAVRRNFKGAEDLRQKLLNKAPKYGNSDEKVDELAKWVTETVCDISRKYHVGDINGMGDGNGIYKPSFVSSGTQVTEGKMLGATPDGRKRGEPVSNGLSPVNGKDKNGLTMALRSAATAGKPLITNGVAMNTRLSPSVIETDEGIDQLTSIMEAYFELGGKELQINAISSETLKDAQAHPEEYPDLSVKVTGYSARFIDLSKELQDDIIERTIFNEV